MGDCQQNSINKATASFDSIKSARPVGRDIAIDLVKGICIILMVVGHCVPSKLGIGSVIYLFHMPCFFIASGFLFKERNLDTPGKYVKRKVKGLWWPFVFWSLVYLLLHNVFAYLNFYENAYSFKETGALLLRYVLTAGTEQLLGGFWFLTSLLFATVVGYAYYKWIGFSNKAIIVGIIISLAIVELLCYLDVKKQTIHVNPKDFTAIAYFLSGTLIARIDKNIISKYRPLVVVAAIVFLALQNTYLPASLDSLTVVSAIPFYITSTTAGLALIQLCYLAPSTSFFKAIAKIGTRTIDVLIFHFLIFKLVSAVVLYFNNESFERLKEFPVLKMDNNWLWVIYTAVAVIFSYYLGQLIIKLKHRFAIVGKIIP